MKGIGIMGNQKKIVISKNLNDKISTRFAIWISFALYASTFVVLILAAYLFDVNCYKVMFSDFNNFLCVVHVSLGIVIGLLFHEFAHALCALACNLEVMEIAVRFDKLRPIAYAKIIGLSTLHSKVEKIFIYFAGVTSHYFILGVALLLSKWNAYMFFIALVNFIFALVNSSIWSAPIFYTKIKVS